MEKSKLAYHTFRILFAMAVGIFISVFAYGATSVQAAESEQIITINDEEVAKADSADNAGSGMFLLMGGMLLIILTVVITVVATFVVTAPIVDEI